MPANIDFVRAGWPAASNIHAGTTTRRGGVSAPPWNSLNLGDHVQDDVVAVRANRERVCQALALTAPPVWLQQVHGSAVADLGGAGVLAASDASVAHGPGVVCAVLTADCLPVLLCDTAGTVIAAAHCGWRGLVGGVLENAVDTMAVHAESILAWLGPAIGPAAFEVGGEVRAAYLQRDPGHAEAFAATGEEGKYLADLYALARKELHSLGVSRVFGGGRCTYSEAEFFYSYRRDGVCGRMASLIWIQG